MPELGKSNGASSIEMELLTVLLVLVVICAAVIPMYKYWVIEPRVKKVPQILSEIVSYVQEYRQKNDGNWPPKNCDTRSMSNNEWIDYVVGKINRDNDFSFYYVTGPNGNVYVSAIGRTFPFADTDKLTFYFASNTWHGTGYLEGFEPD